MPIPQITQTISTLPEAGHRGVDVQNTFVIKQEDFQDHLQGITVGELNSLKDEVNATVSEMNIAVTTINSNVTTTNNNVTTTNNNVTTTNNNVTTTNNNVTTTNNNVTKADSWANAPYNTQVETGKYSGKHWSIVAQNIVDTASINLLRADKYLAAQNIVNMIYTNGDLTKIRYINNTDVNYEVLNYSGGNLISINHYVDSILKGTTTLSYTSGNLISAIYVGV